MKIGSIPNLCTKIKMCKLSRLCRNLSQAAKDCNPVGFGLVVGCRVLDAEPDSPVSGSDGASLSSGGYSSRDAASVGGGKEHQPQM